MTALQTIRMYGSDPSSRNEALDFIDRGIQSLQGVAQATLNAYRPSAPGPDLEPTDLHDVLRLVEPHAARRAVRVLGQIQMKSPVELDAFKIRQITLNLLLNAIQTSPQGGTVSLHSAYRDDAFIITIKDEGPGLPEHAQNFLMARAPQQNDRSLGLDNIRRLTHEMNGQITVHTEEGAGSAIDLVFPRPGSDAQ